MDCREIVMKRRAEEVFCNMVFKEHYFILNVKHRTIFFAKNTWGLPILYTSLRGEKIYYFMNIKLN